MTLMEGFMEDEIFLDPDGIVYYSSDQMFVNCPCRFPVVRIPLMATGGLDRIADRIRHDEGYAPMHPVDGYPEECCDEDVWYEYEIWLNGCRENSIPCISFEVGNSLSPDNETEYSIDLTPDEQEALLRRIDAQCRTHLGKSCRALLKGAELEMEELEMGELEMGGLHEKKYF